MFGAGGAVSGDVHGLDLLEEGEQLAYRHRRA
jgi:hypothetical protein